MINTASTAVPATNATLLRRTHFESRPNQRRAQDDPGYKQQERRRQQHRRGDVGLVKEGRDDVGVDFDTRHQRWPVSKPGGRNDGLIVPYDTVCDLNPMAQRAPRRFGHPHPRAGAGVEVPVVHRAGRVEAVGNNMPQESKYLEQGSLSAFVRTHQNMEGPQGHGEVPQATKVQGFDSMNHLTGQGRRPRYFKGGRHTWRME